MNKITEEKPKRKSPRISSALGRPRTEWRPPCRVSDGYIKKTIDTLNQAERVTVGEMREVIGAIPAMLEELLELRKGKKVVMDQPMTQLIGSEIL